MSGVSLCVMLLRNCGHFGSSLNVFSSFFASLASTLEMLCANSGCGVPALAKEIQRYRKCHILVITVVSSMKIFLSPALVHSLL